MLIYERDVRRRVIQPLPTQISAIKDEIEGFSQNRY